MLTAVVMLYCNTSKHKQIMVILEKYITRELVNPQLLGRFIFFNINTKFVRVV
jgi:hypothetical protein